MYYAKVSHNISISKLLFLTNTSFASPEKRITFILFFKNANKAVFLSGSTTIKFVGPWHCHRSKINVYLGQLGGFITQLGF